MVFETRNSVHLILFVCIFLFHRVNSQCDENGTQILTAGSSPQYFTSPNYPSKYPSNSDCSWRILASSPDDRIIINIEDYDSESITSDYMDLYDGYNASATRIISMAGTNRKALNAFVSSSDVLFFTFVSDYMIEYTGFQILYFSNNSANQPSCDETLTVSSSEQILMSPNLPDSYDASHSCSWTFSSTTGILFQIKFLDMGNCGTSHLRLYDGNSTSDDQLDTACSTALVYEFTDIETTVFTGHVVWTVTTPTSDFYGFMLIYRTNVVTTTSTTTTTTTMIPSVFDNCTASGAYLTAAMSPNFIFINSPQYGSEYPSNTLCRWYISAPTNYAVETSFDDDTFVIERHSYCRYDYVIFYDGNTTGDSMLNKFCGTERPSSTYRSSGEQMLIIFSSDYALEYAGFRLRVKAVDNTYPGCKSGITEYSVMYNKESAYISNGDTYINTVSTPSYGTLNYENNVEMFWLFSNYDTTNYKMVLAITGISIERSYQCIYDKLILYDGPCMKDGIKDIVCGYWAKRWDLDGPEYLLHFHSDGYRNLAGFELEYFAESKIVTAPLTTTTTTNGPPVEAVVDAVKSLLTNYSNENLPTRDLSLAITASIDFYLVGINGLDEVEQMLTTTGQFEVSWTDASLSWDPLKRQRIVQILLPQDDLWKPDIALMNGFSTITAMGAKFMFIDINYNGSCLWKPYQIMDSVCKVDMTHYPYDRQTCVLKFGTWTSDDSEVMTELGTLGLQIHPNFQENSEWRLIKTETKTEDKDNHQVVEFFLTLERNSRFVTFYMTMPLVVLAYMNVFTFVIPTESGEKTGFSITIFLSFVVLLIINNDSMPENSDTISIYASYVLAMTILSTVSLVVCVLQVRALTFSERKYPIAKRVKKAVKHLKWVQSIVTCRGKNNKVHKTDNEEEGVNFENKLENEKLFVVYDDMLENSSQKSARKDKKVSFMDYDDDDDNDDRFVMPRHRNASTLSAGYGRENTLFESDAFVRSATLISMNDNLLIDDKYIEREPHNRKYVSFAEGEENCEKNSVTVKVDHTEGSPIIPEKTTFCSTEKMNELIESRNERIVSTGRTIEEINGEPDKGINAPEITTLLVSPREDSEDENFIRNKKYNEAKEHSLSNNNDIIEHRTERFNSQRTQLTGINNIESDMCDLSYGDSISNRYVEHLSRPLSSSVKAHLNSKEITKDNDTTMSIGVGSNVNIGKDPKPGNTIIDDVEVNQTYVAKEYKMNRPSSVSEGKPFLLNRQFSSTGNRLIQVENIGTVSVPKIRPFSQGSGRVISVLSHRSGTFINQRPLSVPNRINLNDCEQSLDAERKSVIIKNALESEKSDETSSEESEIKSVSDSEISGNDDISWPQLVSSIDFLLFIITLLLTTLITLAMFLTMITAY